MPGNKKVLSIICIVVFLLCIGIMDYPFLSRIYNEKVQGQVISDYKGNAKTMEERDVQVQKDAAREYNRKLAERGIALEDAFSSTETDEDGYKEQLSMDEDGVMGIIEIPKIQVSLPIYHGTSEEVLQKGAGHLQGSSLPVGGEDTHTCISAHRGLPNKKMFTNVDQLENGDVFLIQVLDDTCVYEIYSIETVTPDQTGSLEIQSGQDLATLITCTPYGINTHRIFVHGRRISSEEAETGEAIETAMTWRQFAGRYGWMIMTVVLLVWMFILLYFFNKKGNRKKK